MGEPEIRAKNTQEPDESRRRRGWRAREPNKGLSCHRANVSMPEHSLLVVVMPGDVSDLRGQPELSWQQRVPKRGWGEAVPRQEKKKTRPILKQP